MQRVLKEVHKYMSRYERNNQTMSIKNIKRVISVILILVTVLLSTCTILEFYNLFLIYSWPMTLLIVIFNMCILSLLIISFISLSKKEITIIKVILLVVVFLISAVFSFYYIIFSSMLGNEPYYFSQSPSGNNKLIVMEGGFIDALYIAHPIKYNFFYKRQDNGYASRYDCWGGADVTVQWKDENNAIVKIDFGSPYSEEENDGNNVDDLINVKFD